MFTALTKAISAEYLQIVLPCPAEERLRIFGLSADDLIILIRKTYKPKYKRGKK